VLVYVTCLSSKDQRQEVVEYEMSGWVRVSLYL